MLYLCKYDYKNLMGITDEQCLGKRVVYSALVGAYHDRTEKNKCMRNTALLTRAACYGCEACVQICPRNCITTNFDHEGFLYVDVDDTSCIECGLCEKVCPSLSPGEKHIPLHTYAAVNPDMDIRMKSSSGGFFSLLAERIIQQGGVVYGARFDDAWQVVHDKVERVEELDSFRGSKYVQSRIGHSYADAKRHIEEGRQVMFVGTPCQIAGLHHFLQKPHDNLLSVDFICHGVPSPGVWKWYLGQISKKMKRQGLKQRLRYLLRSTSPLKGIEFRNKDKGWKQYQTCFLSKDGSQYDSRQYYHENGYMRAFLTDMDLRPSCYECKFKCGRSGSDITIADFWNVHKVVDDFDDDKGTSLVLLNTQKATEIFRSLSCRSQEVRFETAIQYNQAWEKPYPLNERRGEFFKQYRNDFDNFVK